jgi:hypothetical protein
MCLLSDNLSLPNRGPRDRVAVQVCVQVEENTWVSGGVQRSSRDAARGSRGSGASHLEVDALGVRLGAVGRASAVKGDDLVTKDVATGSEGSGNLDVPGEAVGDELVGGPCAGRRAGDQSGLGDLDPRERGLVD